jgi:nitrogen fixation NifU-like protein
MTDSIYREIILDHYKNPRNKGTLDPHDYSAEDVNPLCGDEIRIDLRVDDDIVSEVRFEGRGCAVSQASASILTEMIEGKSLEELKALTKDDLLEEIGIPVSPARLKCALLSLNVLRASISGGAAETIE